MRLVCMLCLSLFLVGCVNPAIEAPLQDEKKLTLGVAQKEIRKGLSQTQVVEALGSPNMVTRDKDGTETWVYDKTSYEAYSTSSSVHGTVLLLSASGSQSATKRSQRTLTIIIKFKNGVVSEFTYNATSF